MSFRRLRWVPVVVPMAFLGALGLLAVSFGPTLFANWPGYVALGAASVAAVFGFSLAVVRTIDRIQGDLRLRNRELLALHEAGLAIAGELDLDTVLQEIVERARELVGARYGALSILDPEGRPESFLTSGVTAEERARIGPPPSGRGLLGVVLKEGQRLRISDISADPRSQGFPARHPPMRSLLAVPILSRGGVLGNLYMTEKRVAPEFSQDDEEILVRFATQAAVAIENARLLRQVQTIAITEERERIAREMHDGLAQVLGYVNTKAQAAQELLSQGQTERASAHIAQMGEAARSAYADVRETILGLRTSLGPDLGLSAALRQYLAEWKQQSGIAAELIEPEGGRFDGALPSSAEVQILRIVQEALANVRKHAYAKRVSMVLEFREGHLGVAIEDDGVGFDPARTVRGPFPQFGLATMRERAETVGGDLTIESAPGRGTRVAVRFQIAAVREDASSEGAGYK